MVRQQCRRVVATSAVHCSPDSEASLTESTKWNFNWREVSGSGFKNEILCMNINWNKIGIVHLKVILRRVRVIIVAVEVQKLLHILRVFL